MDEIKFTEIEVNTMLNLVDSEIEEGCYYGNKEQYYKRLAKIKLKLKDSYIKPKESQ